jgi:two-component system response regulator MtrA
MVKILVIDDEYLVRYTLARILRRQGYEVATAADGERGMAVFRSNAPDLVLADMAMPEREGGATIRQMHSERPAAKIIAISHSCEVDNSDVVAMARRLGADDVIGRPFDTDQLLRHLEAALDQDSGATA